MFQRMLLLCPTFTEGWQWVQGKVDDTVKPVCCGVLPVTNGHCHAVSRLYMDFSFLSQFSKVSG